jgi:hypothetical protein
VVYDIVVQRSGLGDRVQLTVDDMPVQGTIVPRPQAGTRMVKVRVALG